MQSRRMDVLRGQAEAVGAGVPTRLGAPLSLRSTSAGGAGAHAYVYGGGAAARVGGPSGYSPAGAAQGAAVTPSAPSASAPSSTRREDIHQPLDRIISQLEGW